MAGGLIALLASGGWTTSWSQSPASPLLASIPEPARSLLPAPKGEPGGVLVMAALPFKEQVGAIGAWDEGKWLGGPALSRVDEQKGRQRSDGSAAVALVDNPYRKGTKAIRMTLRAKDQPPNAGAYRTQISNDPGSGGVTNELPTLGRNWRFMVIYFGEFPSPFPGTVLIDQLHANKNLISWGKFSPSMSLELFRNSFGGVMLRARLNAASMDVRAKQAEFYDKKIVTLIDDIKPGKRYELLWDTNVSFNKDGYWRMWINGMPITIGENQPTTYPLDSLELDEKGVERAGFHSFWTVSQYIYHYKPGGDWTMEQFVVVSGARRHREGMTVDGWLKALASL